MTHYYNLFSSDDFARKREKFKKDLAQIEAKNIDFFIRRIVDINSPEDHDRLENHYFINETSTYLQFGFLPDSGLTVEIQEECKKAFSLNFKD